MWEGVLHMVPLPSGRHQRFGAELAVGLTPFAAGRGLVCSYETGLIRPGVDDDYRVPDLGCYRPELATDRGVDGPADLVVEIRSPGDETDEKRPWYAALGVAEVLVIDLDSLAIALFRTIDGKGQAVEPENDSAVRSAVLDMVVRPVDADRIELVAGDGTVHDITVPVTVSSRNQRPLDKVGF
jgi:Uma2 family endonuclease